MPTSGSGVDKPGATPGRPGRGPVRDQPKGRLGVAAEMGVPVPGELSIVSFDDSVLTRVMYPALTALSRDTHALGVQVAEALPRIVAEPGSVGDIKAATPRLTVRESTAKPGR